MANEFPKNKIEFPTIGRVVYYYMPGNPKPHAAIVTDVNCAMQHEEPDPYTVNLHVFNHDGSDGGTTHIKHVSANEPRFAHWDWMPYQKSQAAKTEELQRELDAHTGVKSMEYRTPENGA